LHKHHITPSQTQILNLIKLEDLLNENLLLYVISKRPIGRLLIFPICKQGEGIKGEIQQHKININNNLTRFLKLKYQRIKEGKKKAHFWRLGLMRP